MSIQPYTSLLGIVLSVFVTVATAHAQPAEFLEEAKLLSTAVACTNSEALPSHIPQKVVQRHCKKLKASVTSFKKRWLKPATEFFLAKVPSDTKTVVYPFAGGDLLSALAIFPDVTDLTTLSLEPSGDPRTIHKISGEKLSKSLLAVRLHTNQLFKMNHSLTKDMITDFRNGKLPMHLILSLLALEIHDMKPLSVRYFRVLDSGEIAYLESSDIEAMEKKQSNHARNFLFENIEIRFSKNGETGERVYRHIRANLDNKHIAASPGPLEHLKAKGKVVMMTKAASFLLWWNSFATIRNYMLDNMTWMISDATGIPPSYATKAGFSQETWGRFREPILNPGGHFTEEFATLWKSNPYQKLSFRFGYPDKFSNHHLVITSPQH